MKSIKFVQVLEPCAVSPLHYIYMCSVGIEALLMFSCSSLSDMITPLVSFSFFGVFLFLCDL